MLLLTNSFLDNAVESQKVVTGINELRSSYEVDNNVVVCQATPSEDGHTYIAISTPGDAWTKELVITAQDVYGYSLKCGDRYGVEMTGLNSGMKRNVVDLGNATGEIAIQFKKAKAFGIKSDFGTLHLPSSVHGKLIAFFWPNDAPSDNWDSFIKILNQGSKVASPIAGVAGNFASAATPGLLSMFALAG